MRLKNFPARDAQLTLGRISFYLNRSGLTWNKPGNKPLYMQIILKPPQGGFLRFGLSGPIGVPESTGSHWTSLLYSRRETPRRLPALAACSKSNAWTNSVLTGQFQQQNPCSVQGAVHAQPCDSHAGFHPVLHPFQPQGLVVVREFLRDLFARANLLQHLWAQRSQPSLIGINDSAVKCNSFLS